AAVPTHTTARGNHGPALRDRAPRSGRRRAVLHVWLTTNGEAGRVRRTAADRHGAAERRIRGGGTGPRSTRLVVARLALRHPELRRSGARARRRGLSRHRAVSPGIRHDAIPGERDAPERTAGGTRARH